MLVLVQIESPGSAASKEPTALDCDKMGEYGELDEGEEPKLVRH
jgi:hypothetical protein